MSFGWIRGDIDVVAAAAVAVGVSIVAQAAAPVNTVATLKGLRICFS
jgi:hypothetical protein